jgi:hypothetical protein
MTAPIPELVARLESKKLIDTKQGEWKPLSIGFLIPLKIGDLIVRYKAM